MYEYKFFNKKIQKINAKLCLYADEFRIQVVVTKLVKGIEAPYFH